MSDWNTQIANALMGYAKADPSTANVRNSLMDMVTNRATFFPAADYADGSTRWAWPGILHESASAWNKMLQGDASPRNAMPVAGAGLIGSLPFARRAASNAPVRGPIRHIDGDGYQLDFAGQTQAGASKLHYVGRDPSRVNLEYIETSPAGRGRGDAKYLLEDFLRQADTEKKAVDLKVRPGEGVDEARLRDFYVRLGFEPTGYETMIRKPRGVAK